MQKTTNTMNCANRVSMVFHTIIIIIMQINNLQPLTSGANSCVTNTEILTSNTHNFDNWFIVKKGEKRPQPRIQKNNYLYIRINCQFFIHNVSNFLTVLFKGVKCVLYCLVDCLLNFFTNFFNLVCTSCWLQKYNIKNHASKSVEVNKVHLQYTKTVPLFVTYIYEMLSPLILLN